MHVRLIDEAGDTTRRCAVSAFAHEANDEMLHALGDALKSHSHSYAAAKLDRAWFKSGAHQLAIVIEDGDPPEEKREPQSDDYVCDTCGSATALVTNGWLNANTGEADEGPEIVVHVYWCHDCGRHTGYQLREDFEAMAKEAP